MFQSTTNGELELLRSDEADIYLQGAHLTRFRDWLFLSRRSQFAPGQSIRGGVPVIFPWFGPNSRDPDLPQHGWARSSNWEIENAADDAVTMKLRADDWDLRMKFGFTDQLRMRFEVKNQSDTAREFECALHTYYAVDDVRSTIVEGLDGKTYLDKPDDYARKTQGGDIAFSGQTDRVYLDAPGPIRVVSGARTLVISGDAGWRSTVVWNPWSRVAAGMADLDDEWTKFVCVECGAIADDAITIAAGETYVLDITVQVEG